MPSFKKCIFWPAILLRRVATFLFYSFIQGFNVAALCFATHIPRNMGQCACAVVVAVLLCTASFANGVPSMPGSWSGVFSNNDRTLSCTIGCNNVRVSEHMP